MLRLYLSRRDRNLLIVAGLVTLTVATLLFLFPIFWIVSLSLKTRVQIFTSAPLSVWQPTLDNYILVLSRTEFGRAFVNSIVASAGAIVLSLIAGVPAAYAFARFRFRGENPLFFSLLIMRMVPPIAVLVPMFVMLNHVGLAHTRIGLILAYTTFSLPLVVWIMRGFFEDLPREFEESAWMDGANRATAFYFVVLPLVRPGLIAAAIISLVMTWNDFLFAAILTSSSTQTLPVLIAAYSGDTGIDWGPMTASAVLVVLPVIVFSFFVQRHLVTGLSSGAIGGWT